jgi:hypothetical protein
LSLRIHLRWANSISTFFRARRDWRYSGVLARPLTTSRAALCTLLSTLRRKGPNRPGKDDPRSDDHARERVLIPGPAVCGAFPFPTTRQSSIRRIEATPSRTSRNLTSFSDCGFPVNQPPFPSSTSTPARLSLLYEGRHGAASGQGSKAGAAIFMAHCLTGRSAGRYAQSSEPRPHGTSFRSAEPTGSKPDPMPRRQSPASS